METTTFFETFTQNWAKVADKDTALKLILLNAEAEGKLHLPPVTSFEIACLIGDLKLVKDKFSNLDRPISYIVNGIKIAILNHNTDVADFLLKLYLEKNIPITPIMGIKHIFCLAAMQRMNTLIEIILKYFPDHKLYLNSYLCLIKGLNQMTNKIPATFRLTTPEFTYETFEGNIYQILLAIESFYLQSYINDSWLFRLVDYLVINKEISDKEGEKKCSVERMIKLALREANPTGILALIKVE